MPSLQPEQLKGVPEHVIEKLEAERCVVPQTYDSYGVRKVITNVVEGELASAGQKDWAVLCSVDGESHITVVWGGQVRCGEEELARSTELPDADAMGYVQGADFRREYFVRQIELDPPADPESEPPWSSILERQGEQILFVHSCVDGKWQRRELWH